MEQVVTKFYEERMASATHDQDDTHALDQGVERTLIRHSAILDVLGEYIRGKSLLDIGCGTGLFLETAAKRGIKPSIYFGTDILDRDDKVQQRLTDLKVNGGFVKVDEGVPHLYGLYNVGVCIGITGFWGMHTYAQNQVLFERMKQTCVNGAIVYPKFYDPHKMGVEYLTRFDLDDMLIALGRTHNRINVIDLEREFILWW